MVYNSPYSSSDGGFSKNGDDHHHHHDQFSTFTGEATSSVDGGTPKQGAAPTPTIQADPSASQSSLSPSSLIGSSGISNPTSSPSDNVFPTVSASDPLITSFSSSTESSTAASLNFDLTKQGMADYETSGKPSIFTITSKCYRNWPQYRRWRYRRDHWPHCHRGGLLFPLQSTTAETHGAFFWIFARNWRSCIFFAVDHATRWSQW